MFSYILPLETQQCYAATNYCRSNFCLLVSAFMHKLLQTIRQRARASPASASVQWLAYLYAMSDWLQHFCSVKFSFLQTSRWCLYVYYSHSQLIVSIRKVHVDLYSAFYAKRFKCAQTWITQFYLRMTPCLPLLPSRRTSPSFGW